MTMPNSHSTMAALLNQAVTNDQDLRDEINRFVKDLLAYARWSMEHGDPATRNTLMRSLIPSLVKSLASTQGEERDAEERAAIQRIMAAVAGRDSQT